MNANILITKEAIQEWGIKIDEIKLDMDGRVWFEEEITNLKWFIAYTPCTKDTNTIIIAKCKKGEE